MDTYLKLSLWSNRPVKGSFELHISSKGLNRYGIWFPTMCRLFEPLISIEGKYLK
jgi:hypothetical protein